MTYRVLQTIPGAMGSEQLRIEYGEVALPLPQVLTDPLFVVFPDWSNAITFEVSWSAVHGATLPSLGAACEVIKDSRGIRRCVWWDGVYTPPLITANGAAGGDLSGTFPNPAVARVNGTAVPLTGAAWIAPPLLNSWAVFSSRTVAYMKDPIGFVHLKGNVSGGSTGTNAFVLPAGFIPGQTMAYQTPGTTVVLPGLVLIDTSGNVQCNLQGASVNVAFDGITFLAEN